MNDITHDQCFSKTSLAKYLDKSIRWLDYQLAGPTPPPGLKIGKAWVFKKSDIDRWLEQFRVQSDLYGMVNDIVAEVTRHA